MNMKINDEDAEKMKADAVNREQRRRAEKQGKTGKGFLEKIVSDLKDKAQEVQSNPAGVDIPMPDHQDIDDSCIMWTWDRMGFIVNAFYFKKDDNKYNLPAGTYAVKIYLGNISDGMKLATADQTGTLAGVLMSAHMWENKWREHAGEYLAMDGVLEPKKSDDKEVEDSNND